MSMMAHDPISALMTNSIEWVEERQLELMRRLRERYHCITPPCRYKDAILYSIDELLPENLAWPQVPQEERHVLLCGAMDNLYDFVKPLRAKVLQPHYQ